MQHNVEIIQAPANTSHSLQPIDQDVNKQFKCTERRVRDELLEMHLLPSNSIGVKLMLGFAGWESILGKSITYSFRKRGLWPMNYSLMRFATNRLKNSENTSDEDQHGTVQMSTPVSISVRNCDQDAF